MPGVIAPDAQVEFVIFIRGHGYLRIHRVENRMRRQPAAFAYTQIHGCLEIATSGSASFIAFRTNMAVAQALLGYPPSEQLDTCVDLTEDWRSQISTLLARLRSSGRERHGSILEDCIAQLLHGVDDEFIGMAGLYDWMLANGAPMRWSELGSMLGYTCRTLERRFQGAGGISPRSIAGVGRFLGSCRALRSSPHTDISEIAHELGFYDHAHFSNQFKRYALVTPTQFQKIPHADMVDPSAVVARSDCRNITSV